MLKNCFPVSIEYLGASLDHSCYVDGVRGGTISLIFHLTFMHTNAHYCGACPHTVAVLKLKTIWNPQGISSLNIIVSVANHSHTLFVGGFQAITLENLHHSFLCKSMGIKVVTHAPPLGCGFNKMDGTGAR